MASITPTIPGLTGSIGASIISKSGYFCHTYGACKSAITGIAIIGIAIVGNDHQLKVDTGSIGPT